MAKSGGEVCGEVCGDELGGLRGEVRRGVLRGVRGQEHGGTGVALLRCSHVCELERQVMRKGKGGAEVNCWQHDHHGPTRPIKHTREYRSEGEDEPSGAGRSRGGMSRSVSANHVNCVKSAFSSH